MKLFGKIGIAAFCAFFIFGCATLKGADKQSAKTDNAPMYEEGKGRADMTLAILRPKGMGLKPDEEKYLDIIQGALNNDFGKFSAIQLFDSKNLETILEQQQLSLSGNYSESDYIRIGELVQSRHLLIGELTRIDASTFILYLSISDKEHGTILGTFKETVSLKEIVNSSASRAATASILPELGVEFSPAGLKAIKTELSAEEKEAQTALALSYEASRSGNLIDALIYSYTASNADGNSSAAREQAASTFKMMGGEGTKIKEDIKRQQYWKDTLKAYENFYRNHPPFELAYTSKPVQKGPVNYDRKTVDFEFTVGLRNRNVRTMQRVLSDILKELRKTDYKKNEWGFNNWPAISAESTRRDQIRTEIFDGYRTFTVKAALFNNDDEPVATLEFPLYGQLKLKSGNRIGAASTQERRLVITVNSDFLTEDMQIRLVSINGVDADKSNVDAYMTNYIVEKLPVRSRTTISKDDILLPELPEERDKRLAAETKEKKKQAEWNAKPLKSRKNIFASVLYNSLEDDVRKALSLESGLGFGYKNFSIDFSAVTSIDSIASLPGGMTFGLGVAGGYSYVWKHFLLSLEGGFTWYNSGVWRPLLEAKFDMVPGNSGLAFRIGYRLEFGDPVIGNAMAGLVIWF